MSRWVIDASVAVKCLFRENHTDEARAILRTAKEAIAPDLLLPEIGSAVWKRLRRKEIAVDVAIDILARLPGLRIALHPCGPLMNRAMRIAESHDRSFYDCLYVALAAGIGFPLVTADRKFHDVIERGPLAPHIVWIEDAARP